MWFLFFLPGFSISCSFSKAGFKLCTSLDRAVCANDAWKKIAPLPGRSVLAKLLWVQCCCQKVLVGLPAPLPRMAQQRGSSAAAGGSCLQSHVGEPCRSAIVWATSPRMPFSLLAGFSNYLHPLEIGFKGSCGPLKYLVQNLGARNECITNSSSVTL